MSLHAQSRIRRRTEILAAARRLISEGDGSLSVRELATAAQTTPRTIYAVVGSKSEIVFALLGELIAATVQGYAITGSRQQVLERTVDMLTTVLGAMIGDSEYGRRLYRLAYAAGLDETRLDLEASVRDLVAGYVRQGVDAGALVAETPVTLIAHVLSATIIFTLERWACGQFDAGALCESARLSAVLATRPYWSAGVTYALPAEVDLPPDWGRVVRSTAAATA